MTTKVVLSADLKVKAAEAITAYGKDWQKQKGEAEKLSGHLLGLAKACAKEADGDLPKCALLFDAAAKYAGAQYQESHKDKQGNTVPIAQLLPYWPVAKAEILRAIRKEVNPETAKSVAAMMKARKAKEAEDRENGVTTNARNSGKGKKVTVSESTAEAMERLTNEVVRIDSHQDLRPKLADLLNKAADAISALFAGEEAEEGEADDIGTEREAA